jgi:Spy/CpxP family protein refolding chaperone
MAHPHRLQNGCFVFLLNVETRKGEKTMTRLYHFTAMLFVLTLALLAVPAASQADRRMHGGSKGMLWDNMMSDMTAEEQKVVQEIFTKHHDKMVDLHRKIFAKRAELNAAMAQEEFDAAKARGLAKEIIALENDLMNSRLEMFIEMREKGVSYYGTCMMGGRMGPCMTGDGMGYGMGGRGMMMDDGMMETGK